MFVLSWEKPKSVHLGVICKHTVVSVYQLFWTGWDLKKTKWQKQAFQFLQLVVHMYFVPVELFILEIKEKNLYWKKCLASQCGLALPGSWVGPFGGVKKFWSHVLSQKKITFNSFTWSLYMFLTSLFSYILMGLGSSKSW